MNYSFFYNIKKHTKKIYILLFISLSILSILYYTNQKYKTLMNNFKTNFNNHNYPYANNLIITQENANPFKLLFLKNDLSYFFYDELNSINNNIKNKKISNEEA